MTSRSPRLLALGLPLVMLPALGQCNPAPAPAPTTYTVTHVVDGDTVNVKASTGAAYTIRLIGIDTPEVGRCGAAQATAAMNRMVAGKRVSLAPGAKTDKDHYGRLLRYVNVGSLDAGRHQIELGLAVARYDSRDGYGAHPRQADYVRVDAAVPNVTCAAAPAPAPPAAGVYYANCDAVRAAGKAPLYRGQPGYETPRLDRDGDGIACE
jgi:endonuclease YncB( thermonuclease family)